jgi:hypothetical protein
MNRVTCDISWAFLSEIETNVFSQSSLSIHSVPTGTEYRDTMQYLLPQLS